MSVKRTNSLLASGLMIKSALIRAVTKLNPRDQLRNPVMFTVYVASILTTLMALQSSIGQTDSEFTWSVAIWLWFTLLFANFAESLAEGRGKAQASALRKAREDITAKKLKHPERESSYTIVNANQLVSGDVVLIETGDFVPGDGEVIEGIASVNESAITGESAPVIRESGGDRNTVTGGTQVISDWLIVRITVNPGETFLDHMIALVEGSQRKKTPNELALTILLAALSIIFLFVCSSLQAFSAFRETNFYGSSILNLTILVALYVCLAPTTIGALLSAIGIAGMNRMIQANVIAMTGQAVEAAGDIDVLLLDKTGTITLGNRQASNFVALDSVSENALAEAAQLASLADETPEGRSIVLLANERYQIPIPDRATLDATFIPFSAETRMSGANLLNRQIRKGAVPAIKAYIEETGGLFPEAIQLMADQIARQGATPLVVTENNAVLGIVQLQDVVKPGIRERFMQLRTMGIKTIMITGDNPLTAAAIAAEAGVDDFFANAKPEDKLSLIRRMQAEGRMVAMVGDGTNDAPALAQADVAVAMNSGTQSAKEAGNLIDLDSNPTKLIEIIEIGKQLLMTRGALTTFSFSNDVAKYFAILPAAFASVYPQLYTLNVMQLKTPESAILSAVIFNALIIIFLIPLALRGVHYRPISAIKLLKRHVLIYGLGGFIIPFLGIKLIDTLLNLM